MPSDLNASFADIAFLAADEPRLTVLRTLAATAALQSRQDLAGATALPSARVDRILGEFEAREWIVETDAGYRVTPSGTVVVEGFTTTLETLETECRLREVIQWVPTDAVAFDVRCLGDAEIVLATESDPSLVVRRLAEWVGAAERVQALSFSLAPPLVEATRHATMHGEQRFEAVLTPTVFAAIQEDATIASAFVEILESGNARVFVADAELPLRLAVVDGAAVLALTDEEDTLRAVMRTDDDTARGWAADTFDTYRGQANGVESDAFTP